MTVELGIFARIFTRPTAEEVAAAVAGAGFGLVQLNLSCIGAPTVPPVGADVDFAGIRSAFEAHGVRIWGLSCTYNLVHPDLAQRAEYTARAEWLIGRAPELGAEVVTLCSGTRDAEDMWRAHPGNSSPEAWAELRTGLDKLLPAAQAAGVRLGIEPNRATSLPTPVARATCSPSLAHDARFIGIVLDPANLVTPATALRPGQDSSATLSGAGRARPFASMPRTSSTAAPMRPPGWDSSITTWSSSCTARSGGRSR